MERRLTQIDVRKLQKQLNRAQIACLSAIAQGDCATVARLTCETATLRDRISLAPAVFLDHA